MTEHEAFTVEQYETRSEWLAARRTGVGGSEVAAIVGLQPTPTTGKTPFQVYASKVEDEPDSEFSGPARWGVVLEDPIADEWSLKNGTPTAYTKNTLLRNVKAPHRLVSPDRLILGPDYRPVRGLEVKAVGARRRWDWEDEASPIPPYYYVQVQWSLAVTGLSQWHVAALLDLSDFRDYTVEPDEEMIPFLEQQVDAFWERVVSRSPPVADGTRETRRALERVARRLRAEGAKPEVTLGSGALALHFEIEHAKAEENAWKLRKDTARNRMMQLMGGAQSGKLPLGFGVYVLSERERAAYEVPTTSFLDLRYRKPREKRERKRTNA